MTREQKIKWLENASNEDLLKQYETTSHNVFATPFGAIEYEEDYELVRAELLRRMTK